MEIIYSTTNNIASIKIDNGSYNEINYALRFAIYENIIKAINDTNIKIVIITGNGECFSEGIELNEISSGKVLDEPSISSITEIINNAHKPFIAAINGNAYGIGLEIALSCHFRIVLKNSQISFPEIKLGLITSSGAVPRLIKWIGLERSLNFFLNGNVIDCEKFSDTKLFSEYFQNRETFGNDTLNFSKKILENLNFSPFQNLEIKHENPEGFIKFSKRYLENKKILNPVLTKFFNIVETSFKLDFEEVANLERNSFIELVNSNETKAFLHIYFAKKKLNKIEVKNKVNRVKDIDSVAVIGGGLMGTGIIINFINAGIPVILLEINKEKLEASILKIKEYYETQILRGKITNEFLNKKIKLLSSTTEIKEIKNVDLVIEAVFEDLEIKKNLFKLLDQKIKKDAIFATNTSTLNINDIASCTSREQNFLGMHFFSPAQIMKLIEIVKGEKTSDEVLITILKLAYKINKIPVISGVCDGFIGNRMIEQYLRQAYFLLEEGCFPHEVDNVIESFGFAMGPFKMCDLAGNDIGWNIRKRRLIEKPSMIYSNIPNIICEKGRFGQKTSAGWYDYELNNRKPIISQEINDIIINYSKSNKIIRRKICRNEIIERLIFALICEGSKILEEGIAQRASDIDIIYLTGYGFPIKHGGPMFYADKVGLKNILSKIEKFNKIHIDELWKPSKLMLSLAKNHGTFNKKT